MKKETTMNLDSIKSDGAARLEGATEAARRGAKSVGRGASLVRQSASEHPYVSAAIGVALAGVGWALLRGSSRQRRQDRLLAGAAVLAGVLRTLARGKFSRGVDGAGKLGKAFKKWGRNQKLGSFAKDNVGSLLAPLLPLLADQVKKARKRFN
jgi:hypothetical protein